MKTDTLLIFVLVVGIGAYLYINKNHTTADVNSGHIPGGKVPQTGPQPKVP